MDYFELYNIPRSFHPDPAEVKKKFYELSRQYHPDRFTLSGDTAKAEALRMSALNNEAYKVLNDPDATMSYILKLHEALEDEEKYNLPPAFLLEVMELNETLSDYETDPENETAKSQASDSLEEQLTAWNSEVGPLTAQYHPENPDTTLLQKLKDHYFRKKYLLRIKERIDRFAAP
jgi:molecular chaperone HscB